MNKFKEKNIEVCIFIDEPGTTWSQLLQKLNPTFPWWSVINKTIGNPYLSLEEVSKALIPRKIKGWKHLQLFSTVKYYQTCIFDLFIQYSIPWCTKSVNSQYHDAFRQITKPWCIKTDSYTARLSHATSIVSSLWLVAEFWAVVQNRTSSRTSRTTVVGKSQWHLIYTARFGLIWAVCFKKSHATIVPCKLDALPKPTWLHRTGTDWLFFRRCKATMYIYSNIPSTTV